MSLRPAGLAMLLMLAACTTIEEPMATAAAATVPALDPPVAERRPHTVAHHGIRLEDPYAWLKDQSYPKVDDPDVLAYLRAENAHFEAVMAPQRPLVDALFKEMRARIKEDDASVPVKDGDWLYWWAFDAGAQYRKWYRRPVSGAPPASGGEPQLIIDEPAMAEGLAYFRLGGSAVSPDGRLLAYTIDNDGSERFKLMIRDLATGRDFGPVTEAAIGAPVWSADSRHVAYTQVNENWRPWRVLLHRLETDPAGDRVLYEEADPAFFVGLARSQDRSHFIIHAADHVTSEVRLVSAANPTAEPVLVSPRQTGREYEVDVSDGTLFIRANDAHKNFRVATATLGRPADWRDLIPGSDSVYIRGLTAFRDYLAITERVEGLDQVRLRRHDGAEHRVRFPEASYTAGLGDNPEHAPPALRLSYQSMVSPATVFDYDPGTRMLTTRKVQEIPSGYDASQYETVRLMAPARDGTSVPVSIVYRKGFPRDGSGRVHLYGYGAYGHAIPPGFSTTRLSLVDRGVAYAIAHIRGGDDLGYQWYLDGKLERRANTYTDFVDVARHLIAERYTREGNISASGGSAGGNLMGVVLNTNPELWRAVVAHVPFVDMLNTMLDASLPLTPIEWPEWGNPIEDEAAFRRILALSPYENVRAQDYPPILVTAGLNDPRVTYWEPAKWVARLRAAKTDDNPLLLKTNMGAGHGGKSGRWESLREVAEEYAFILTAFGLADASAP